VAVRWRALVELMPGLTWGAPSRAGALAVSYPFLDQNLVKVSLAMPPGQLMRPGETRSLHRRSMRGILPEDIRQRLRKSGPDEAIVRTIEAKHCQLHNLFADSRAGASGYLAPGRVQDALTLARGGQLGDTVALLRALAVEHWLRCYERWRPSSRASAPAPAMSSAMVP
jgi:asparagine synthase (glutamine-hydrolysing)